MGGLFGSPALHSAARGGVGLPRAHTGNFRSHHLATAPGADGLNAGDLRVEATFPIDSSSAMTYRIDRAEALGLVERRRDPKDRRGVIISLTPRGRELAHRDVDLNVEFVRELLRTVYAKGARASWRLTEASARVVRRLARAAQYFAHGMSSESRYVFCARRAQSLIDSTIASFGTVVRSGR